MTARVSDDEPLLPAGLELLFQTLGAVVWFVFAIVLILLQGRPLVDWDGGGGRLVDGRLAWTTFLVPLLVMPLLIVLHFARGRLHTALTTLFFVGVATWLIAAVGLYVV